MGSALISALARPSRDYITCPAILDSGEPCEGILAEKLGGDLWRVKHRGGTWITRELVGGTCPKCGREWRPRKESA